MLLDTALLRLSARIDPRTKVASQLFNDSTGAIAIAGLSGTTPVVVTTVSTHGLQTGMEVYIIGNEGTPLINNSVTDPVRVVTVTGPTTFTVPITFVADTGARGTVTPARIGASRGNAFEPQQLLDIWNAARLAAFAALRRKYGEDRTVLQRECGTAILTTTTSFTGTGPTTAPKPTGYFEFISMYDNSTASSSVSATANQGGLVKITTGGVHNLATGDEATVAAVGGTVEANNTIANPRWVITRIDANNFTVPVAYANAWTSGGTVIPVRSAAIHLVGPDRAQAIREGRPNYTQSATNRHVWESGTTFVHSSTFVTGTVSIMYIGITDFTLANVLSGTTSETFADQHLPALLELAEAISLEMGGSELTSLADKLLGGGK